VSRHWRRRAPAGEQRQEVIEPLLGAPLSQRVPSGSPLENNQARWVR
jgi:hypothetical protein